MLWTKGWRDRLWSALDQPWDLIVIGGGITGAGILREAARMGLRTLLVEAHDFAAGTSSRSSKLVHGGFRYLKNYQIKLTFESVRERERLIKEARGLVNPLGFLYPVMRGDKTPGWVVGLGLIAYDLLALKWGHRYYDSYDIRELCPPLTNPRLRGGYRFFDAQTDDARLVLRVLGEGVRLGGLALNYARATSLLRLQSGQVCGVVLQDEAPGPDGKPTGRMQEVRAHLVINATGAWGDALRRQVGGRERLRRLRGSHLILPQSRLPLTRAVSFVHPHDGRFVFAFPWEGVTLVGTTDVDHHEPLGPDPAISAGEIEYLLEGVRHAFPDQELEPGDIQGTFAGVRPVIGTGKKDPSKESREHVLWCEDGLLTVAGGKLTTFRLMARQALRLACAAAPRLNVRLDKEHVLDPLPPESALEAPVSPAARLRLLGRHGANIENLLEAAVPDEFEPVPGTLNLWTEVRWAARAEGVVHLDDLLLRRVRLGLILPQGGLPICPQLRPILQEELGWDDIRWKQEFDSYARLWRECYYLGETCSAGNC